MTTPGLQFFAGYSLVDITATGVTRCVTDDNVERNQQRNWETVLQCIGLRTQPIQIHGPRLVRMTGDGITDEFMCDLKYFHFGDFYQGEHHVWNWTWAIESTEVYDLPNKPLGGLQLDFEQVPVITYLTETARFMLPIFYPYGTIKNIYFTQLKVS
jgi:hypothetical protein